jgi:hypothetical protein
MLQVEFIQKFCGQISVNSVPLKHLVADLNIWLFREFGY